jgi:hypothetical protein
VNLFRDDTGNDNDSVYLQTGSSVLHWRQVEGAWIAERVELPALAKAIGFDAVPDDLREEIIAAVVRTKAVGMGGQGGLN